MIRYSILACIVTACAAQSFAADEDGGPWSHAFKLSAFTSSILGVNEDVSHDATINGTSSAVSYLLKFEGNVKWKRFMHTIDENLLLKFGETSTADGPWTDSADEITYEAKYDYADPPPHLYYVAFGLGTVFTGPAPEEPVLDPFLAKLSAGYGQRHYLLTIHDNTVEWRVGGRIQRKFGDATSADEAGLKSGIEAVVSYKGKITDDVDAELKYDAFAEFEDINHIQHLLTAMCTVNLSKVLKLEVSWRFYFEHQPEDAATAAGYDEISYTQNTQFGMTYTF